MSGKKTHEKPAAAETEPRFRPVVDALRNYRDVTGGKMMSSYGLRVNREIFRDVWSKSSSPNFPKPA